MATAKPIQKDNSTRMYGAKWPHVPFGRGGQKIPAPQWYVELQILRFYDKWKQRGIQVYPWTHHFIRFTQFVFNDPQGIFYFEWNPNARRILQNFHKHNILAISGHASSGKTETLALIGAMMFFLFPKETKVIVTSTTVSAAKDKVWGKIKIIWSHLERFLGPSFMPGKIVDSQNRIRFDMDGVKSELTGIVLLAAESSPEKESADKLQGTKGKRMIVIGDEFATLKHSLLHTVLTNLQANPECKLAGAFNPSSFYDPSGTISRPKEGWHAITEQDDEWETFMPDYGLRGYCIRFDGEKSPNVLLGQEKWKGLLTLEKIKVYGEFGSKTKAYYSQIRGFWSPTGDLDAIYSEAEIIKYRADGRCTTWLDTPTMVAGLDPAYTHGGDRAVLSIGKVGWAQSVDTGQRQKVFELVKFYILDDDVTNKQIQKSEWVVGLTKKYMAEHKVDVRNLCIDGTGGGDPFSALIARDIGLGFQNVMFSGKPSEMQVSRNDARKGTERFKNMASELWYVGKDLIRSGQIKGLHPDLVAEMTARTYSEQAGKVEIESKVDMKKRTKRSPDIADAFMLCLFSARKLGLSSTETAAKFIRNNRPQGWHLDFLTKRENTITHPTERYIEGGQAMQFV